MGRLDGKVVFITGAGSGMGMAIAERFAAEGAALGLIDVNDKGLKQVARRTGALAVKCDVS